MILLICFLVTALLSRAVLSMPYHQDEEFPVDVKLLSEESSADARVRREADSNLPDLLAFQLSTTKGNITLQMKRSRLLPTSTDFSSDPVPFSQDAAVFTDLQNGAAIIVRNDGGQYTLKGTILSDQAEWNVEPVDITRRQSGGVKSHRLLAEHPNAEIISYLGDAIEDDERKGLQRFSRPTVEILSLEERNRYHFQRLARLRGQGKHIDQRKVKDSHEKRETNGKSKRAAVQHIVEMVFISDYADFQKWVRYSGISRAYRDQILWYTYVAEAINIRFRTISDPTFTIGTKVVYLKRFQGSSSEYFIKNILSGQTFDGSEGLDVFRFWVGIPSTRIPNADHYMLFTGYDIRGAIGIAYLDRACTASGVSITENDFTARVGAVAAHELGHSVSCTQPRYTGNTDRLPPKTGKYRPGIWYDRNEQCGLFFGNSSSSYCSGVQSRYGGENSLCSGMWCNIPTNLRYCRVMMPLEYTNCGYRKWCRLGYCVTNPEAPTTTTRRPTTRRPTTSRPTTSRPTTRRPTTTASPGPRTIFDCIVYLLRLDFLGLLICFG
ncbi:hypothetical protein RRG08_007364 [Elysia crispata]|uniref:ADAMTS cysteine-rich domain-containing protein n=1 Tax=Elysia crispata TaxID=231223 RepID=A0AAE1E2X2_9GAST|nr:hypothetical protein RRG08_007364 [Elysia crispata]